MNLFNKLSATQSNRYIAIMLTVGLLRQTTVSTEKTHIIHDNTWSLLSW